MSMDTHEGAVDLDGEEARAVEALRRCRDALTALLAGRQIPLVEVGWVDTNERVPVVFLDPLTDDFDGTVASLVDAWNPRLVLIDDGLGPDGGEVRGFTVNLIAEQWLSFFCSIRVDAGEDFDGRDEALELTVTPEEAKQIVHAIAVRLVNANEPTSHERANRVSRRIEEEIDKEEPERSRDIRLALGDYIWDEVNCVMAALKKRHNAALRENADEIAKTIAADQQIDRTYSKAALARLAYDELKAKDPKCVTRVSVEPVVDALQRLVTRRA